MRRVLMFMLEKLPKGTAEGVAESSRSNLDLLKDRVAQIVAKQLDAPFIPPFLRNVDFDFDYVGKPVRYRAFHSTALDRTLPIGAQLKPVDCLEASLVELIDQMRVKGADLGSSPVSDYAAVKAKILGRPPKPPKPVKPGLKPKPAPKPRNLTKDSLVTTGQNAGDGDGAVTVSLCNMSKYSVRVVV